MSDIQLDEESAPATPASGQGIIFIDSTTSLLSFIDDTGRKYILTSAGISNAAIASQGAGFAADTYVTNSDLLLPSFGMQAKTRFAWKISASKSGAGTATPIYVVRIGAARTTADTARLTMTGPAQTAIADIGTLEIIVSVRNVGAAGILQGTAYWSHRGTAASTTVSGTGFANDVTGHVETTGGAFDNSALGGLYVGLSINGGTSAAWTITQVHATMDW